MTLNHRSNDPPTSVMAGRDIESTGLARMQRSRCLRAVIETPGLTAREIEDRTEVKRTSGCRSFAGLGLS